ncbi:hypothetical protein NKI61_31225 [Mesorhizobium sp. M0514]|uniref:hypothetical protein n=1 Tax=Mesorhizobium sp. M0514 TaxID=2956955 RepID=UPI0033366C68
MRKIKPLVSDETQSPKPEPTEIAGAERLRAFAPEKIQETAPILVEQLWGILKDIREALEPHFEGKKVANGALVGKVEHAARRAEAELQSVAVFVDPNSQRAIGSYIRRAYHMEAPGRFPWSFTNSGAARIGPTPANWEPA